MLNFKYKFLNFGKIKPRRWKVMTNKELLYVEDALGHEEFMKKYTILHIGTIIYM